MPKMTSTFHSEWRTIRSHRVFIECRDGFPSMQDYAIAELAVTYLDANSTEAHLVKIFDDDKNGIYHITIGSCTPTDENAAVELEKILQSVFATGGGLVVRFMDVLPGNRHSDHFNLCELLAGAAGLL